MNGNKEQVLFEELLLYVNFTQNSLIILLGKRGIVARLSVYLYNNNKIGSNNT